MKFKSFFILTLAMIFLIGVVFVLMLGVMILKASSTSIGTKVLVVLIIVIVGCIGGIITSTPITEWRNFYD